MMILNLDKIESLPIAFSQVREDPLLDLELIRKIPGRAQRVLMVASGGDTLSLLASQKNVVSIDAVDASTSQLVLSQAKLKLLAYEREFKYKVLGHLQCSSVEREELLSGVLSPGQQNILGPQLVVVELGLDFIGRYEMLFKGIQGELASKHFSGAEPDLDFLKLVFHKYFDLEILIRLFGREATQNPVESFAEHFYRRTVNALNNHETSPFLEQLLYGGFSSFKNGYEWHKLPVITETAEVSFHNAYMLDFMKQAEDESYHFIHLSNILDWLNKSQAEELMRHTERLLVQGGKVVIRQLNSSLDIKAAGSFFDWQDEVEKDLLEKDKSFFYRKIHVGVKNAQ